MTRSRDGDQTGGPRIVDIVECEVEHGLGVEHGPFVVLRVMTDKPVIALGHLDPAAARQVAGHLLEAAARAEYEGDLQSTLDDAGVAKDLQAAIFAAVRVGEIRRHTSTTTEEGASDDD